MWRILNNKLCVFKNNWKKWRQEDGGHSTPLATPSTLPLRFFEGGVDWLQISWGGSFLAWSMYCINKVTRLHIYCHCMYYFFSIVPAWCYAKGDAILSPTCTCQIFLSTFTHPLQFFKLDVLYECPDGTLAMAPSGHIIEQLHRIIKMTPDPSNYPVGILTSDHRDAWTQSRERLLKGEFPS